MSVIVWDGVSLACDSHANDGVTSFPITKIWRGRDYLYGGVGLVSDISAMVAWFRAGRVPSEFPKVSEQSEFLVINRSKIVMRYTNKPFAVSHGRCKLAIGTGRAQAYGALFWGHTADECVKAAIAHNPTCGGDVYVLSFVDGPMDEEERDHVRP